MASYFQSFRSSLMPKQLLRFALSRLDVLDADALDIDNLDFAIGRNTVLEFRDVGLILPVCLPLTCLQGVVADTPWDRNSRGSSSCRPTSPSKRPRCWSSASPSPSTSTRVR